MTNNDKQRIELGKMSRQLIDKDHQSKEYQEIYQKIVSNQKSKEKHKEIEEENIINL